MGNDDAKEAAKEYAEAGNHYYPNERDVANAFEFGAAWGFARAVELLREERRAERCEAADWLETERKKKIDGT